MTEQETKYDFFDTALLWLYIVAADALGVGFISSFPTISFWAILVIGIGYAVYETKWRPREIQKRKDFLFPKDTKNVKDFTDLDL